MSEYNKRIQEMTLIMGYFFPFLAWAIDPKWYYKESFNEFWEGAFGILWAIMACILLMVTLAMPTEAHFQQNVLPVFNFFLDVALWTYPVYLVLVFGPMVAAYFNYEG